MTVDFETELRALMDRSATAVDVSETPDAAEVERRAAQRSRRRQMGGAFATLVVVAVLTIGVGLGQRSEPSQQVFAASAEGPLAPGNVVFDGERYVGISVINPEDVDHLGNAQAAIVVSTDGMIWEWLAEDPVFLVRGPQLRLHNGIFHVVSVVRSQDVASASTEVQYELLHASSADLEGWEEDRYVLPSNVASARDLVATQGLAFIGADPIVQLVSVPDALAESGVAALRLAPDELCEVAQYEATVAVRKCGEQDIEYVERDEPLPQSLRQTVVLLQVGELRTVELPEPEGDAGSVSGRAYGPDVLYQTSDGVGLSGASIFESSNGVDWSRVDIGREPSPLLAVRGDERLFRSWREIRRFGSDDPVKGMGYSSDGGETWIDVRLEESLPDAPLGLANFSDLTAFEGGWLLLVHRTWDADLQVEGVDRGPNFPSDYRVAVDGYVLEGHAPFGAAELRDPTGLVVRSWEQLELTNPHWSGLDVVDEGIAIAAVEGGEPLVTISFAQWRALVSPYGPNTSDVLFSSDGLTWSVVDSSSGTRRLLAVGDGEILLQRFEIGLHSHYISPVEIVTLPTDAEREAE